MQKMILARLAVLLPTLFIGSVLIFGMVQAIPGGAAVAILGPEASGEEILALEEKLGLNRPLAIQYGEWLGNLLSGDLGKSLIDNRSIASDLKRRMPRTVELAAWSLLVALLIGVPLGIIAAIRHHTRADSLITGVSGLGLATPEFWLAMLAVNLFALQLGWFPAIGIESLDSGLYRHLNSLVLPVATLASTAAAVITRFTRSGMLEALNSDYVRTAWALGIAPRHIYFKFALKNAMTSVVVVAGILAGHLIGGAVLVEQVFAIPGMGTMLITGALQNDYPTVQGVALALTVPVVLLNLVADIICGFLDPRSRS
jgi:peptide/nickel transport system permease protein